MIDLLDELEALQPYPPEDVAECLNQRDQDEEDDDCGASWPGQVIVQPGTFVRQP